MEVEWGEYKLKELFEVKTSKKRFDANKVVVGEVGYPYVVRTSLNNGLKGYIQEDISYLNEGNTISFGQDTATVFYQMEPYFTGDKIKILKSRLERFNRSNAQFFITAISIAFSKFGWGSSSFNTSIIENQIIALPTKNKEIDFEFIDSFIAELEAERIAELEAERIAELSAYLKVSGLDNYELSDEELKALRDYDSMEWREYRIGSLFSRISTKKLPYKAKNLPTEALDDYELPCLTSSFRNQGLNYYVPREGATILKDVISIPSNSDVYRAYFQSREFTVLSDAYAIKWTDEDRNLSNYQYLFMVRAINKVTDLPIYSYKMKLGGWNVVKDKNILLPVIDDEIAFNFMEDYARAISKLVIKDVVQYTNERIETTKEVVTSHNTNY